MDEFSTSAYPVNTAMSPMNHQRVSFSDSSNHFADFWRQVDIKCGVDEKE